MEVRAENLTIEAVLKKGKYTIPKHQRQYAWEKSHLESFILDISKYEEDSYFIGHMVCTGDFNGSEFNVIDGQQRITTITIMLCALRDIFFNRELIDLADGINNNYIFPKDRNNTEYVVLQNKQPYPILQKYVQNTGDNKDKNQPPDTTDGEKRIITAYEYFYSIWKDGDTEVLGSLRNKILDLEIIFVATPNENNAFSIFETLNARGKPLDQLDLIKNQIFKHYKPPASLDEPNDSWQEILKNSSESKKFLGYFWASRYKKISNKKIYIDFQQKNKEDRFSYNDFLKDLLKDSKSFKKIISPNINDWNQNKLKIYFSLFSIRDLKIEVANSFLISLLREFEFNKISNKYFIKALEKIERFHFIYNKIAGERSSGLDNMYSKLSKELHHANDKHEKHQVINRLIQQLHNKLPTKETFSNKIDERLYYHSARKYSKYKKTVQYALTRLEYEAQNYNVGLFDVSIEHLLTEDSHNIELVKDIGNLVLLDRDLNSAIGNQPYAEKRLIILGKSTLATTKDVCQNNSWDEDQIKTRKQDLIEKLYEFE